MMPRHQRRVSFHMCVLCSLPRGSHIAGAGIGMPTSTRWHLFHSTHTEATVLDMWLLRFTSLFTSAGENGWGSYVCMGSLALLASEANLPSCLICVIFL